MSKEYLCKAVLESGEICNETAPDKFSKGRYTICIDCKRKYHRTHSKKQYEAKKIEFSLNPIENLNENIGKIGDNMKRLIEDMIYTYPFKGIGIAIPEKFIEFQNSFNELNDTLFLKITELRNENYYLKENNKMLLNKISNLDYKIDEINSRLVELSKCFVKF